MGKTPGSRFARRILFSPLRWWFGCGIISVVLFVLVVALVSDYRSQLQLYPGLVLQREMARSLHGKRIDQIIPEEMANGEVVWLVRATDERRFYSDSVIVFSREENRDVWDIAGEMRLYGVRMPSSTDDLTLSRMRQVGISGFIASPDPNGLVDYLPAERMLTIYDSTNGSTSSGDIVYLFRR